MANKRGNILGFGNLTGLRPINNTTEIEQEEQEDTTITNQYNDDIYTKIIRIKLNAYQRLKDHSRRYYNIESYDTIIKELIDNYDKHNYTKYFI